jgi:hypothetical protein
MERLILMRSILLHVHQDDGMEARLQVALDIARAFGAHLTCLQTMSFDGAHGHKRTIETVFGGVTRELLSDPPLPVFTAR